MKILTNEKATEIVSLLKQFKRLMKHNESQLKFGFNAFVDEVLNMYLNELSLDYGDDVFDHPAIESFIQEE